MHEITTLVDRFAAGRLSRRDLVRNLAGLVAAAASQAEAQTRRGTFEALDLNHLALRVTDPDRSQAFYARHLGMTPIPINAPAPKLVACGPHTVTLFKADRAEIDHVCFTVPDYDAKDAAGRLRAVGLTPEIEDDRVHFRDPDGYRLQVGGPAAGGQLPSALSSGGR